MRINKLMYSTALFIAGIILGFYGTRYIMLSQLITSSNDPQLDTIILKKDVFLFQKNTSSPHLKKIGILNKGTVLNLKSQGEMDHFNVQFGSEIFPSNTLYEITDSNFQGNSFIFLADQQ